MTWLLMIYIDQSISQLLAEKLFAVDGNQHVDPIPEPINVQRISDFGTLNHEWGHIYHTLSHQCSGLFTEEGAERL